MHYCSHLISRWQYNIMHTQTLVLVGFEPSPIGSTTYRNSHAQYTGRLFLSKCVNLWWQCLLTYLVFFS